MDMSTWRFGKKTRLLCFGFRTSSTVDNSALIRTYYRIMCYTTALMNMHTFITYHGSSQPKQMVESPAVGRRNSAPETISMRSPTLPPSPSNLKYQVRAKVTIEERANPVCTETPIWEDPFDKRK